MPFTYGDFAKKFAYEKKVFLACFSSFAFHAICLRYIGKPEKLGGSMRHVLKHAQHLDITKHNFEKPLLDTIEAAAFLNFSNYTLRRSRSTGRLFGVPLTCI